MKKIFIPYIYILLFYSFLSEIHAQNSEKFTLQIISLNTTENNFLLKKEYGKIFQSKNKILLEINQLISSLKKEGFYTVSTDSIVVKKQAYKAYLSLGSKTTKAIIQLPNKSSYKDIDLHFNTKEKHIELPTQKIADFLKNTSAKLSNLGRPFSQVKLQHLRIEKGILYGNLVIEKSAIRTIDSVIVKGYENFPKNYLNHFYKLQKNPTFNKEQLLRISKQTTLLKFASELKPPQILFSKDSTILYLYLTKKRTNSFDGLLNFSSKENNKGISFNGYLDINLNNIFNYGEELAINWQNTGENKQFFEISTKTPYIFNTKIITEASFSIYKHDSTFLNTKLNIALSIPVNDKLIFGIFYNAEKSENLLTQTDLIDITGFSNNFTGIQLKYQSYKRNEFNFEINTSLGSRSTFLEKNPQYKLNLSTSILLSFNRRFALFLKNNTGYLNSKTYFQNELFRIGGVNSIRGFSEQSIFTSAFSFVNSEFRLSTQKKSYLYSVFDFGAINDQNSAKYLFGFGAGYSFKTTRNLLDISYVIGKPFNTPLDVNASRISIKMLTFF